MFSSLRFRLWLTYLLIVGIVIGIVGVALVIYLLRNPYAARLEVQRLRVISALLIQRTDAGSLGAAPTPDQLQAFVEQADKTLGVRVAVYDSKGSLIADSRASHASPLPDITVLRNRQANVLPQYRDGQLKAWLYHLQPFEGGYSLLVSSNRPRPPVQAILRDEFNGPLVRAGLLATLVALLLAIGVARWVSAPLQRMAETTRNVSDSGSLAEFRPLPLEGPSEVRTLAQSFNEMADRVQANQRAQRDFVANVSHELKTPLTSIQGFAQAILDGTANTPEALQQSAQVIYSDAGRMHRMVLELLDLARLESGIVDFERLPVDLHGLLQGILEKYSSIAQQAQVSLQLKSSTSLAPIPTINGDADRLAQVFTNLVDNALKFTPAGGHVEIGMWTEAGTAGAKPGDWILISVSDSGPGIPEADLDRIFERFYQLDKSRSGGASRGVGLGLAIAREIVQAHDGTLSAYNIRSSATATATAEPDQHVQGSTFVVKLPVAPPGSSPSHKRKLSQAEKASF